MKDDLGYEIKVFYKWFKRFCKTIKRKYTKKCFTDVLFITYDELPFEFISAITKQYPEYRFNVIIPLSQKQHQKNINKTNINLKFFLQNKNYEVNLFQLHYDNYNIATYGIPMNVADDNLNGIYAKSYFIKAARQAAAFLKPDIIHCENIPYFMGAEFDKNFHYPYKVLQTICDYDNYAEFFWIALNILNRNGIKKLCKDKYIRKCTSQLFNQHDIDNPLRFRQCLDTIYQNYDKFRQNISSTDSSEENTLFKRLNNRTKKLFPQLGKDGLYNIYKYTLTKANHVAIISKTYYDKLLTNEEFTKIKNIQNKSSYVSYGKNFSDTDIRSPFTNENFREKRIENKKFILKELSQNRIKTKFTDPALFKNTNCKIYGYLDFNINSMLILCEYANTTLKSVLSLFQLNKNIQVIIRCKENTPSVEQFVNFCKQNEFLDGKWIVIEDTLNLPFFASACDIWLDSRLNIDDDIHYQMLKYGTIPVVFKSGIYNDTITDIYDDMNTGCGFKSELINDEAYEKTLLKAVSLFIHNHASWNIIIKNALNYDSNWNFNIIEKYNTLYEEL